MEQRGELNQAVRLREELSQVTARSRQGDLTECLRWAERTVGVLVRRGQRGPNKWIGVKGDGRGGQDLTPAKTFFNNGDLQSSSYIFADATEEEFAAAIERAKKRDNLSRAEVVSQIVEFKDLPRPYYATNRREKTSSDRHQLLKKTRRINVERVINASITTLQGVVMGLNALSEDDYLALTPEDSKRWGEEINQLVGEVRKFRERVKYVSRSTPGTGSDS